MKVAIVTPVHIQPSAEWVTALQNAQIQDGVDVIVVDDSDGKVVLPGSFLTFGYESQKAQLGEKLYVMFEQFHKSSACKQFGLWYAWKEGYDVVIVIDSDCIIPPSFVKTHLRALEKKGGGWGNPLAGTGFFSRGYPYSMRELEKWAHMGLWTNELDLYGTDRIEKQDIPTKPPLEGVVDAAGAPFPLSGMNVSFVREAIPYMLFLPNFTYNQHQFTRHDDIWGGYIFEKIAKQKRKALSVGEPFVYHDTIVVPQEDAEAEKPMIKFEDDFYSLVDNALVFTGSGCGGHSGPEIFSWLSDELGASDLLGDLRNALKFQSLAFA